MEIRTIELVIVGAGGAASEALWVAQRLNASSTCLRLKVVGLADDNPQLSGKQFDGFEVIGTVAQIANRFRSSGLHFHCAIGNNRARQRVSLMLEAAGMLALTLIDPSATVAPTAYVGDGTYVGPLSVIAPHARVGRHVLINTHVGVGHHATVSDYAQLCPGVRVNGGCSIDTAAFLGSNVAVHPGLSIGEGATIGANSFVIRSVKPRFFMMGVPARIVSRPAENGSDAR